MGLWDKSSKVNRSSDKKEKQEEEAPPYEPPPYEAGPSRVTPRQGSFALASQGASFTRDGPGMRAYTRFDGQGRVSGHIELQIGVTATLNARPDAMNGLRQPWNVKEFGVDPDPNGMVPKLQIVIFFLGSGELLDIYIAFAIHLIETYEHTVRFATPSDCKSRISAARESLQGKKASSGERMDNLLECFDVPGSGDAMSAYILGDKSQRGEGKSSSSAPLCTEEELVKYYEGLYRATYLPHPSTSKHCAADVIIASPICLAAGHIASALNVPLVMLSSTPWSPTTQFPHPMSSITSNCEPELTNYLSWPLVDAQLWAEHESSVKQFAASSLGLKIIPDELGASFLDIMKVPFVYIGSPQLPQKPIDWMEHIEVINLPIPSTPPYIPGGKDKIDVSVQHTQTAQDREGQQALAEGLHRHLPFLMRCDIEPSKVAVWYYPDLNLKLSAAVAGVLVQAKKLDYKRLEVHRSREYNIPEAQPPIPTGKGARAVLDSLVAGVLTVFLTQVRGTIKAFWPRLDPTDTRIVGEDGTRSAHVPGTQRVTSFKSGSSAAGREFAHSLRDGVYGVGKATMDGAKAAGPVGMLFGAIGGTVGLAVSPLVAASRATNVLLNGSVAGAKNAYRSTRAAPSEALRAPREAASREQAALVTPFEHTLWLKKVANFAEVKLGWKSFNRDQDRQQGRIDTLIGKNVSPSQSRQS